MAPIGLIKPLIITLDTTSRTISAATTKKVMICFNLTVVSKISSEVSEIIKSHPRFAI